VAITKREREPRRRERERETWSEVVNRVQGSRTFTKCLNRPVKVAWSYLGRSRRNGGTAGSLAVVVTEVVMAESKVSLKKEPQQKQNKQTNKQTRLIIVITGWVGDKKKRKVTRGGKMVRELHGCGVWGQKLGERQTGQTGFTAS